MQIVLLDNDIRITAEDLFADDWVDINDCQIKFNIIEFFN